MIRIERNGGTLIIGIRLPGRKRPAIAIERSPCQLDIIGYLNDDDELDYLNRVLGLDKE